MAQFLNTFTSNRHYFVGAALLATSSIAAYSTYKLLSHDDSRLEVENKYETEKLVNEYLVFHYGAPEEVLRYSFGPRDALDFPRRVADEALHGLLTTDKSTIPNRALDIGCAVGRTSFELAREFEQVVGIDFSHAFIDTCNLLKDHGSLQYSVTDEGDLCTHLTAVVDSTIDRKRCHFQQGDACNLPLDLGLFGCVVGANLICRLPDPMDFLNRVPGLVASGGLLVLTTPASWDTEFTPKAKWLGGFRDKDGKPVTTLDSLKRILGPDFTLMDDRGLPMFIRETARKNQWTVPQLSVWRRK
ncbi:uncharacterized protein LOC121418274 [Lytechinus variegatus]|uniref:uncharacterized protein LOC121418274 n=1 Tax=Lytechinus variegatus TaxID=7654 RepID=UPI001BB15FCE|nr:uncharacterized protein LOC121418274 [Lytechinus variegatus]